MKKLYLRSLILGLGLLLLPHNTLEARSFRVGQIPNGNVNGCLNCHMSASGGDARNAFGQLVESSFLDNSGNVLWGEELALADADGDGYSNGHELEDPFGLWTLALPDPGNSAFVTRPGSGSSLPSGEAAKYSVRIDFQDMTPHIGQYFEIRLVDVVTDEVISTQEIGAIAESMYDFTFSHALESGMSYNLDFWADLNGSGAYEAPPADHAWRVALGDISDNVGEDFHHNTSFIDIGSPLALASQSYVPSDFNLAGNYPNPFNPSTVIPLELRTSGELQIHIYDLKGTQVSTVFSGFAEAGAYAFTWQANDPAGQHLPAGVYLYTASFGGKTLTQSMLLLK